MASRLNLATWPTLLLIFATSVAFACGLGPTVIGGLYDLGFVGTNVLLVTSVTVGVLAIGISAATIYGLQRYWVRFSQAARGVRTLYVIAGSVVLAVISLVIATTDQANNTAWNYANKFETSAGVSKAGDREFGRNFARLNVSDRSAFNGTFGEIPTDWKLWIAGGRSTILLRIPVQDSRVSSAGCDDDGQIIVHAIASTEIVADSSTQQLDICGQWQRIDIGYSSGTTGLSIGLGGSETGSALDVMLVAHEPHFSWFWLISKVVAIAILLSLVAAFSMATRDRSENDVRPARWSRGHKVFVGVAVALFLTVGNIFVYTYVSQEHTIYTWDFSGYWASTRNVSEFLNGAERKSTTKPQAASPAPAGASKSSEPETSLPDPSAIAALIRNFRFAEYNVSASLALAPALAVFGGSRMVYELSLLNVYGLAAMLLLIVALRAVAGHESVKWPQWWPLIPMACVFCFVPFWVPILRGYIGITVVGLNCAVLWLYFREPAQKMHSGQLAVIGALLLASVILQRWNAYWVVAFFVLVGADSARIVFGSGELGFASLARAFRAPIVIGFSAFFLFSVVAWPKVITTVTTDYSDIYSAFLEDDNLAQALVRLINAFGGGLIALTVGAFAFLVAERSTRRIALLVGLQLAVMFIHFSSTQTIGPHHMYILMPGLLIVLSLAIVKALTSVAPSIRLAGVSVSILVLISGYASGMAVYAPQGPPHLMPSSIGLLSQSYRPPLVRNDLDELVRLAEYIDNNLESGDGFYVLAGSQVLNPAHFKNIELSTGVRFESAEQVLPSSVLDIRDGFPRALLSAQLVVTSDPIEFRRPASDQQVIRIPAESLMKHEGIGKAFERMPETFRLDSGAEVLIFKRTRPNTVDEIADLSRKLRLMYPDRPAIYE